MKKPVSLFLFILINWGAFAQTKGYNYYSDLDRVGRSGFYHVELTPEISAHLKPDLTDIRIVNNEGKWIPHLLRIPANIETRHPALWDLKYLITENSIRNTVAIIEKGNDTVTNIIVEINNTTAQRFCTLSGSDNKQNWYVINDSILPDTPLREASVTARMRINFPPISYPYLRLTIRNNNKDPYNITGIFSEVPVTDNTLQKKIIHNPLPVIRQKDSGKISYVTIIQREPYLFSNITLEVAGVRYFSRKSMLYIPGGNNAAPGFGDPITSFTISNNSTMHFRFPLVKSKILYLLIHNEDNLPLTVSSINTGYDQMYITGYLEQGKTYRIITDNPNATAPDYDLSTLHFKYADSIPFLHALKPAPLPSENSATALFFNKRILLWSAVSLMLVVLLFFTLKMLREINKNKPDDHL